MRFDGGHKREDFLVGTFGKFVTFVPVCPEVDIGLGTPRESLRLVRELDVVRMVAPRSGSDHTEAMTRYAERKTRQLEELDLSGYILKKDSPSCGMERVKVYDQNGVPSKTGRGLFAEVLLSRLPHLPVEEEGRLRDALLRENFVERVFAYRRLRDLFTGRWGLGDLVRFHTASKLLLLAHEPKAYQALGKLVAGAKGLERRALRERYEGLYLEAMATIATRRRHVNVLQHMAGYFKKVLSAEEKAEMAELIDDYRRGLVPLVAPITLLKHHVRLHEEQYLAGQLYLDPHPKELMLRNHV